MSENAVIRVRIDGRIKDEAAVVLATLGLTVSGAFSLLRTRVAHDKALPFKSLVSNDETIAAMRAAREGKVTAFSSVVDLMKHLNAAD